MNTLMNHQPTQVPVEASQRVLFTVEEFVQLPEFSYLTRSSLRHLIFNSSDRESAGGEVISGNGLDASGAIVRIGRKVLINSQKFREWIMHQRKAT